MNRPRYADVAATLALVLALGGTAMAVSGELPRKSVDSVQIKKFAVINPKIADHAIAERNMRPQSIDFRDLIGSHTNLMLSLSLNAGECKRFVVSGLGKGGANGQPAFLSFTGTTSHPIPAGLTVSPIQLLDGSAADVSFCNMSANSITLNNQPAAIVSFGDTPK